jgi:hypothetical protein
MEEDIIYFDKNHPLLTTIKNYIITQCSSVCREEIHEDTVSHEFSQFDFGYIRKCTRIVPGIRNFRKTQKETVHSFVLCNYIYANNGTVDFISIHILCNSKNNSYNIKDGVDLLKIVESKARQEHVRNLALFSLGKIGLKKWYMNQGFKKLHELYIPGTKTLKVYFMKKEL